MTGAPRDTQTRVAAARVQLVDVVHQLRGLYYLLRGIATSLPRRAAASRRLRADLECVLADSIAPALAALERAGQTPAVAPPPEEEE